MMCDNEIVNEFGISEISGISVISGKFENFWEFGIWVGIWVKLGKFAEFGLVSEIPDLGWNLGCC
jgi:hypothetical protein